MRISRHEEALDELLRLDGASVLDPGCGKADKARLVAQRAAPLPIHKLSFGAVKTTG